MAPVILEARDVIAGGRYLQQVRISTFSPSSELPEGIPYSLCLVELESGEVVLLYDIHRGKSHHRHLRGEVAWSRKKAKAPEVFFGPARLPLNYCF